MGALVPPEQEHSALEPASPTARRKWTTFPVSMSASAVIGGGIFLPWKGKLAAVYDDMI